MSERKPAFHLPDGKTLAQARVLCIWKQWLLGWNPERMEELLAAEGVIIE